jgi:hypothetical protein
MSGFSNRPRVLKGAFVEYGLSVPPLAVVFQFNPVQLQRSRALGFRAPNEVVSVPVPGTDGRDETVRVERPQDLANFHAHFDNLDDIRTGQIVSVQEETLAFDLRLDAGDPAEGDAVTEGYGVGPALSTLELMTYPKTGGVLSDTVGALLGDPPGYRFNGMDNPPIVLFIWGVRRVLPVNINGMSITETEFDTLLNPTRATVAVSLTVIEGRNAMFLRNRAAKEEMSLLNIARTVTEIRIPG